jgi:hypothetical protein
MKGKTPTPLQRFNFLVAVINKLWILIVGDQHKSTMNTAISRTCTL